MFRRIVATLTLAVIGLLAVPALASAETPPYPAPPVTPGTTTHAVTEPAVAAYNSVTSLANTGAGISVGTALLIGAVVLAVGLALVLVGNRFRKAGDH